jgi:FkbM family methyltransferase
VATLLLKTRIFNYFRKLNKISVIENMLVSASLHGSWLARKIIGSKYLYNPGTIRECRRNGINYRLDISDYLDHGIYFNTLREDTTHQLLFSLVKEGFIIIDVGGNIGHLTLPFAKLLHNTGKVYCFEPVPFLFERLSVNVSLNNFSNIQLVKKALTDGKEELFYSTPAAGNSGGTFLSTMTNAAGAVESITLDDFVRQNGITQINLVKIDVEGFELKVLKGAAESIKKFKPVLIIEVDDEHLKRSGSSAAELVSFLSELQYRSRRTDNDDNITAAYNFSGKHFDVISLPLVQGYVR